jgi:uncharacterized circularly permuted ATP-grasp superfamily protein
MVEALRRGLDLAWSMRSAAGILETRAFLAFMPRIAASAVGEDLKLPERSRHGGAARKPSARHVRGNVSTA